MSNNETIKITEPTSGDVLLEKRAVSFEACGMRFMLMVTDGNGIEIMAHPGTTMTVQPVVSNVIKLIKTD